MFVMIACTSQIHKIVYSDYIEFVLFASMYNDQRPDKNWHYLLLGLRYFNERTTVFLLNNSYIEARCFQVNT